jgi:dihydroorotase
MKFLLRYRQFIVLVLLLSVNIVKAQEYDILLKGGNLIDAKNEINGVYDIAILDGKIAAVGSNIAKEKAKLVVNAKGLIVTPGLIDIHGHNFFGTESNAYLSNSFSSLPPDGFTFRSGVTTIVDAGGAGWKNFSVFKEQTIDKSKTRVLSFINIIGSGMKGGAVEQNIEDMDPELTAYMAKKYPGVIVGVKLAHFNGFDWEPLNRVVEAGRLADIPVMIDFGGSEPALSLEKLFLEKLRPGDIFTHAYAHVGSRSPIVDEEGKVKPFVFTARDRGIIFDVGHGGGSFAFEQAIPAVKQGLQPNSISTDLHTGSMNGGMKDMTNIMSKFLNMNMPLEQVIASSTWNPAEIIQRSDLGHLSVGADADIAVFKLVTGKFGFVDTKGIKMLGSEKLECELTIREGKVVWDLNGISMSEWNSNSEKE